MADDQLLDKLDSIGWSQMRETDKFEWKEATFTWAHEVTHRILEMEHTIKNIENALRLKADGPL